MTSGSSILRFAAPPVIACDEARGAWPAVAAFVGALSGLALLVAMKLSRAPPPARLHAS